MIRMSRSPLLLALATTLPAQQPDLFTEGWLTELLTRDVKTARTSYEKAANNDTLPRSQRALAMARLGELHSIRGRSTELQATYRSLAGLGIDLGIDRGEPFPAHRVQDLGQLSKRFGETLARPAGKGREEQLGRLRQELSRYLDKIRDQNRTRRRAITPHPLLQRVVLHERQPREPVENKELQALLGQRLKALQQGDLEKARQLLLEINTRRTQLPARNISILQRMRGKRMAWITEMHLRNETENARARERMLFRLPRWQERAVNQQMARLGLRKTTDEQRLQALLSVRRRVQQIAERPAISQWEREVLDELDARLAEHARNEELMEALELVARLPYRYELLQDLMPR
jgi:hypothetical protein